MLHQHHRIDSDELIARQELSKLSKSQLIRRCKIENVPITNSSHEMYESLLIKKLEKKQKQRKNPPKNQKNKGKSKKYGIQSDRSKLIKLFQTSDKSQEFDEFVSNHSDQFVIAVIDIILDKSADSNDERDLSTMLFHQFEDSENLWLDLEDPIRQKLKRKLLKGISEISINCKDKISILSHIIAIISTFEEWDDLILEITDFNSSIGNVDIIETKLKILTMISCWAPQRLEVHSSKLTQLIYNEILKIEETNNNSFESYSLFTVITAIIGNIDDIDLMTKIMKMTLVFLLKSYIINYEMLNLFDGSNNLNINMFNNLDFNMNESYEAAKIYFELLCKLNLMHFDKISCQLQDELFFVLNVFTKMNGFKIQNGLIQFAEEQSYWKDEEWNFVIVSQCIFSIFFEMEEKHDSYDCFTKYFKKMNDNYNLIENIILNINYDIDENLAGSWTHLLNILSTSYVHYFWHKKHLFCPLLLQWHPFSNCADIEEIKEKLYNQEWFAVRWFVRNNYEKLYDQIYIPIMEIILKYISKYVSIDLDLPWNEDNKIKVEYDVINVNQDKFDPNTINYNVTNELILKHKQYCLIIGFIKTLQMIHYIVPKVITDLIHDFYPWIVERFAVFNKNDFLLENKGTLITLITPNVTRSVYGKINIEPNNRDIHEWKFKVINGVQIGFGIDESDCKMIDCGFLMPSPIRSHYSYAWTGGKYNMDENYKPYGDKFGVNDIITMILDGNLRTLRFLKNGVDQRINTEKVDLSKTLKMSVSLNFSTELVAERDVPNCCVSLISYKCATYNANK